MFIDSFKKKTTYIFILILSIFILFHLYKYYTREEIIFFDIPKNNMLVVKNQDFILKGSAFAVKSIYLNKKEYFLDEKNNFSIPLNLFYGYNEFNFSALTDSSKTFKKKIIIFLKEK